MATHDKYEMDILSALKKIANSIDHIEKYLNTNNKGFVEVTKCKYCKFYISYENIKNDEIYKNYKNGLCMCTDKWTDKNNFCSDGNKKED